MKTDSGFSKTLNMKYRDMTMASGNSPLKATRKMRVSDYDQVMHIQVPKQARPNSSRPLTAAQSRNHMKQFVPKDSS